MVSICCKTITGIGYKSINNTSTIEQCFCHSRSKTSNVLVASDNGTKSDPKQPVLSLGTVRSSGSTYFLIFLNAVFSAITNPNLLCCSKFLIDINLILTIAYCDRYRTPQGFPSPCIRVRWYNFEDDCSEVLFS